MVGRGEDLGIDRAVAGKAGQVVVGEPRIVLFGAEQVGGEVVGRRKAVKSCQTKEPSWM